MLPYKKPHDEERGATAYEDDLNYKNVFSFLSTENYQNFLNNYSQNHFPNDGAKIQQDDAVHDILYGQISDLKQPLQNIAPKRTNAPYFGDQNIPNFYHTQTTSELRPSPQTKEVEQKGLCFDFPMDLSSMFLQNPGLYEPQDAYQSMNSACSIDQLSDPILTNSHCLASYDEPKNIQSNNAFYHFTKDHLSDSTGIYPEGIYTKGFEILRENSEHKFQSLPCLEPSIKGSDSLNAFHVKDVTISSYNNEKLKLNTSTISPTAVEKNCSEFKRQKSSQNFPPFVEFAVSNSSQSLNSQSVKNVEHVLPAFRNPSVGDCLIPKVPVLASNTKPNQNVEISLGSKNANLSSQIRHYEAPKKTIYITKKGKELKPHDGVLKHKPFCRLDDLKLAPIKKLKSDYVKILPAGSPSKPIPTVNITIHQVPNTYKMPPSYYMDTAVPNIQNNLPLISNNLGGANRNLTKALTSKKAVRKIPVSIKARNAKFLCAEKDLRCRTVRELLETCETIQGKTGMKAQIGPCMNLSAVPAEYFYEPTPQTLLFQTNCLHNSTNNPQNVENKDRKTIHFQTAPEFQKKVFNIPAQRIFEKNYPKINVPPDNSVRVYQPVVETWKMQNFASDKKNAFKPKHFDFSFLQIRNFKYFCSESDEKRTSKLKLIFSKKKLVYEFQLKETFDASGGCMKHLAMIEIRFSSIVAMWGHESEFRLEVNEAPHMYGGTRFYNKDQQFGPHQNAQYDRSRTADLTLGELYQVPFHYIQLRSVCASKVLSHMSHFSPHFERMLRYPLVEDMHKVIPQIQLSPPELVPVRINKIYMPNNGLQLNKPEVPSLGITNGWQPDLNNFRQQFRTENGVFRTCPHRIPFV